MQLKTTLTGLAIGSLMLSGAIVANPFASSAQDVSTPTGQMDDNGENANPTPVVGTPLLSPAIDLTTAQETALNGQSGASVIGVDLDGEDGVLVYDVHLDNGVEVELDATTGEVLKTEQVGDSQNGGEDKSGDNADQNGDNQDDSDAEDANNGENDSEDANNGQNDDNGDQNGDNQDEQGSDNED